MVSENESRADIVEDAAHWTRNYYKGDLADRYDADRVATRAERRKWDAEAAVVQDLTSRLPPEQLILDVPCGTGRFDKILADRQLMWLGADISFDMIANNRTKNRGIIGSIGHVQADGLRLPFPPGSIDHVLCARFLNLIPLPVVEQMMVELNRITRNSVVLEVRLGRNRSFNHIVRRVRRARTALLRSAASDDPTLRREPIRVHTEVEFGAMLQRTGWEEVDRAEVIYTGSGLRPGRLFFLHVRHR